MEFGRQRTKANVESAVVSSTTSSTGNGVSLAVSYANPSILKGISSIDAILLLPIGLQDKSPFQQQTRPKKPQKGASW